MLTWLIYKTIKDLRLSIPKKSFIIIGLLIFRHVGVIYFFLLFPTPFFPITVGRGWIRYRTKHTWFVQKFICHQLLCKNIFVALFYFFKTIRDECMFIIIYKIEMPICKNVWNWICSKKKKIMPKAWQMCSVVCHRNYFHAFSVFYRRNVALFR